MADIQKGRIISLSGVGARVQPYGAGSTVTPVLTIPVVKHPEPIGEIPAFELSVNNNVVFTLFGDGTGIILSKM